MTWTRRILMVALTVALVVGPAVISYRSGYQAGLRALNPPMKGIAVVRANGNPNSSGTSYSWYNLSKPEDAARFRARQEQLKAKGANFYITEPNWEWSMHPSPDPRRANKTL